LFITNVERCPTQGDRESIRKLILERWSRLRTTSPNLKLRDPRITVYLCGSENELDVQGVIDYLTEAAASEAPAAQAAKARAAVHK